MNVLNLNTMINRFIRIYDEFHSFASISKDNNK